eukprot:Skav214091  [mRNA]  locus=scaffold1185:976:1692:+ [translate_table: standard]
MHQFVEYWAGTGNLTRALLDRGWLGRALDIDLCQEHDCLTMDGLRLWLDLLMSVVEHGLVWMGPPCSSFVVLCRHQADRFIGNKFLGAQEKAFVKRGNSFMSLSAMIYLLSCVLGNMVVLEQPDNSVMPLCPQLSSVLQFTGAMQLKTYLGCFGGPSVKPLQLWTNKRCFLQLSRQKPSSSECHMSDALVTRGPDGEFTGKKDLLQESQVYPPQFGRAVAEVFSAEFIAQNGQRPSQL